MVATESALSKVLQRRPGAEPGAHLLPQLSNSVPPPAGASCYFRPLQYHSCKQPSAHEHETGGLNPSRRSSSYTFSPTSLLGHSLSLHSLTAKSSPPECSLSPKAVQVCGIQPLPSPASPEDEGPMQCSAAQHRGFPQWISCLIIQPVAPVL